MFRLFCLWLIFTFYLIAAAAGYPGQNTAENKFFPIPEIGQDSVPQVQVPLFNGDTLSTGIDNYAEVLFLENSKMRIPPLTELVLSMDGNAASDKQVRIEINRGNLYLVLDKQENIRIEVITNTTIATIENGITGAASTGFYWVEEGSMEILAIKSGQNVRIHGGMFAQISDEGTDILTGQLVHRQINQLSSRVEGDAGEKQLLRFYYQPDEEN